MRINPNLKALIEGAPSGTTQVIAGGVSMTISKLEGMPAVVSYPRDAVLDADHLAVAFRCGLRPIARMDLPLFFVGIQPKYIWGQVLDYLAKKAMENAA